jgi:hypothetical protein
MAFLQRVPRHPPNRRGAREKYLRRRNVQTIRLLDEWLADKSGYDEETWEPLRAALETNRLSGRRLFRD